MPESDRQTETEMLYQFSRPNADAYFFKRRFYTISRVMYQFIVMISAPLAFIIVYALPFR